MERTKCHEVGVETPFRPVPLESARRAALRAAMRLTAQALEDLDRALLDGDQAAAGMASVALLDAHSRVQEALLQ